MFKELFLSTAFTLLSLGYAIEANSIIAAFASGIGASATMLNILTLYTVKRIELFTKDK